MLYHVELRSTTVIQSFIHETTATWPYSFTGPHLIRPRSTRKTLCLMPCLMRTATDLDDQQLTSRNTQCCPKRDSQEPSRKNLGWPPRLAESRSAAVLAS